MGAITFVQRFGGALNLNVHFHCVIPDGVFVRENGNVRFVALAPPLPRGRTGGAPPDGCASRAVAATEARNAPRIICPPFAAQCIRVRIAIRVIRAFLAGES